MKIFKNKLAVTIIVLSVAFFGMIIYTIKSDQKDVISGGAGSIVSPLQKIVYGINSEFKGFVDFLLNFSEVKAENKSLKSDNIELENKLLEYNNFKEENERLKKVNKLTESKNNYDYLGCNIIGYSGGNFLDGYIIDKGEKDGLVKDMIVISAEGLVGQVIYTGSNWATVESLISPNIAVAIMVDSTRDTTGILKGYKDKKNNNILKVENIPLDSKIKEGDVIMTSGLGLVYPKEIRIGEVVSVSTDNVKVMKSAIIKPYVDFNKLEELFVVMPKETREIKYD